MQIKQQATVNSKKIERRSVAMTEQEVNILTELAGKNKRSLSSEVMYRVHQTLIQEGVMQ